MPVIVIQGEVSACTLPLHSIDDLELPTFQRRPLCSGLQILQSGVEENVGPRSWLDDPNQFPTYVCPRSRLTHTHPYPQGHQYYTKPFGIRE